MQERRWAGLPAIVLCAIAAGISYYLFARGVKLERNIEQGSDFCSAVFQASCDATLLSDYSKLFGVSFAAWGAAYYVTLLVLVLLSISLRGLMHRQLLTAAIVVNLGGIVVSGYLSWLLLSAKVAFCPLCFLTHVLNLLLLPTLLLFRGGGPGSVAADVASGLNFVFATRSKTTIENTARALAIVASLLVGVVVFEWFMLRSGSGVQSAAAPQQIIDNIMQTYMDEGVVEIAIGPDDPRMGPANAPLQLVVFGDFECPSCKANERRLERLMAALGDQLSIVFKHAPLSSECNPNVAANPHAYACGAALAGIAANMQGKFGPFHNAVYHLPGAPTPSAIEEVAQQLGLDVERLKRDMESDAAKEKLKQDVELAGKLKVILTPSMFLNGRALNNATAMHLGIIAQELLAGRQPPSGN